MSRLAALAIALTLGVSATLADARTDCYAKSGDAAIRACTEAIALNPRDAVSHVNRAYEYLQKGEHARSIADYSRAIEIDPRRWDAFQGRAWAHLKAAQAEQGLADADAALKLKPDAAQALDQHLQAYGLGVNGYASLDEVLPARVGLRRRLDERLGRRLGRLRTRFRARLAQQRRELLLAAAPVLDEVLPQDSGGRRARGPGGAADSPGVIGSPGRCVSSSVTGLGRGRSYLPRLFAVL